MPSVLIDGQMYQIIETDAFGMPERLETSDGIFRVVEWHDAGLKALALEEPSTAWIARQQARKDQEDAREAAAEAAREAQELDAREAEMERWARKRGLLA